MIYHEIFEKTSGEIPRGNSRDIYGGISEENFWEISLRNF